jgi:mRNA interferase MazF
LLPAPTFRVTVEPSAANGLRTLSQVMVDKVISVRRERIGRSVGRLDEPTMTRLNRSMAVWLGIA